MRLIEPVSSAGAALNAAKEEAGTLMLQPMSSTLMLTVPLSKTYWSLPRPNQTNGQARQPILTYPLRPPALLCCMETPGARCSQRQALVLERRNKE
jgi:hypothetical protein